MRAEDVASPDQLKNGRKGMWEDCWGGESEAVV